MARTRIKNVQTVGIGLPAPYRGILGPGRSAVVGDTVDVVIAELGGVAAIAGVLEISTVSENEELGFDDSVVQSIPLSSELAPGLLAQLSGEETDFINGVGVWEDPITAHVAASDPHAQYQKESEKSAASGYASLDGTIKVPTAELGSGTANALKFLRGDRTWEVSLNAEFVLVASTETASGRMYPATSAGLTAALAACAAITANGGWARLTVDNRFGDVTLPTGAYTVPSRTIWDGLPDTSFGIFDVRATCYVPEGCTLPGLRYIGGRISFVIDATATPIVSDFAENPILVIGTSPSFGFPAFTCAGGAPMFDIGAEFVICLYSGHDLGGGFPVVNVDAGGFLYHVMFPWTSVQNNFAAGTGDAIYVPSVSSFIGADQSGIATLDINPMGQPSLFGFGNLDVGSTTATRHLSSWGDDGIAPTSARRHADVGMDGVIRGFGVRHSAGPGNANMVDYTVMVDGVATGITADLVANAATQEFSSDVFFQITADQGIGVRVTKAASIVDGNVESAAYVKFYQYTDQSSS